MAVPGTDAELLKIIKSGAFNDTSDERIEDRRFEDARAAMLERHQIKRLTDLALGDQRSQADARKRWWQRAQSN